MWVDILCSHNHRFLPFDLTQIGHVLEAVTIDCLERSRIRLIHLTRIHVLHETLISVRLTMVAKLRHEDCVTTVALLSLNGRLAP